MYRHEVYDQLKMEMPFGVTLREDNRWVILSKKFPWEEIDREYQEHFKSSEGPSGHSISSGLRDTVHPGRGRLHR